MGSGKVEVVPATVSLDALIEQAQESEAAAVYDGGIGALIERLDYEEGLDELDFVLGMAGVGNKTFTARYSEQLKSAGII